MEALSNLNTLVVSQRKEWGEILTGFETRNKYVVFDAEGNELYKAAEHAGSTLARIFLKAYRPFEMSILRPDGDTVLRLSRPFRFYFHEISVFDATGALLGTITKRFSILRRHYSVADAAGLQQFELFGPIFRPWTFFIQQDGVEVGRISKKWSGIMKEAFTDADNFSVQFPGEWEPRLKAVFLGAVFLIDFVHFENKGNN